MKLRDQLRKILKARIKAGLTSYRIAEDLGMRKTSLNEFIKGNAGLSLANIEALFDYLQLDLVERQQQS